MHLTTTSNGLDTNIPQDKIAAVIDHLSDFVTQQRLDFMSQVMGFRTRRICVVLENIYQPHNASAVLRSCDCFGIQDIHIIQANHVFKDRKAVSLGAAKWLTTIQHRDGVKSCVQTLKERGYRILATTLRPPTTPVEQVPCDTMLAVFFGNEDKGLSEVAHEMADEWIYLPMVGFTQSYNISVAVALTLQRLTDRLRRKSEDWHLSEDARQHLMLDWLLRDVRGSDKLVRRFLARNSHDKEV